MKKKTTTENDPEITKTLTEMQVLTKEFTLYKFRYRSLKLVSAIFCQNFIFHQMIALQKL